MKKLIYLVLFSGLSLQACGIDAVSGEACQSFYREYWTQAMSLNYQSFDQTEGSGFRPFALNCREQAIDLLLHYIVLNGAEQNSLRWHLAQLLGEAGRLNEAEAFARSTLKSDETGPFKWNDYVLGYIAYWHADRTVLQEKIAVLKAHPEHPGNAINAKLLTRYLESLD